MMKTEKAGTHSFLRIFCRFALAAALLLLVGIAYTIEYQGGKNGVPDWGQVYGWFGLENTESTAAQSSTRVWVLDVGQGDAVLLEQDGQYCLIDTGTADSSEQLTYDLRQIGADTLEYLVLTHPHADHIGGALAVLETCSVRQAIVSPQEDEAAETASQKRVMDALEEKQIPTTQAQTGQSWNLGSGTLTVLLAGLPDSEEENDASLCLQFKAGDFTFLDTGDAESAAEEALIQKYGTSLQSTLFKAGHHGSSSSNGLDFLRLVKPQAVAISCGLDNPYGHPHRETMENLAEIGTEIYRTDLQGTILFTCQNDTLIAEPEYDEEGSKAA